MLFAAMHPDQTSALVTINGYARLRRAPDYPWGFPAAAENAAQGLDQRTDGGPGDRSGSINPGMAEGPRGRLGGEARAGCRQPSSRRAQAAARLRHRRSRRSPDDHRSDAGRSTHEGRTPSPILAMPSYLVDHIAGSRFVELAGQRPLARHVRVTPDPSWTRSRSSSPDDPGAQPRTAVLKTVAFTDIVGSTEMRGRPRRSPVARSPRDSRVGGPTRDRAAREAG